MNTLRSSVKNEDNLQEELNKMYDEKLEKRESLDLAVIQGDIRSFWRQVNLSTAVKVEDRLLPQPLAKVIILPVDAKEKERTKRTIRAALKMLLLWLVMSVRVMQSIVLDVVSLPTWLKNALRMAT